MGSLAKHEGFRGAARDALGGVLAGGVDLDGGLGRRLDPEFVAVSGAARGAKGFIDRPEPRGCNVEEGRCSLLRERVLDDSSVEGGRRAGLSEEL